MAQGERIIFMGTSSFAGIILSALLAGGRNVIGVYSQPDRAAGRGMALRQSEVKRLAVSAQLPVFQPLNFKTAETVSELAALRPDFLIVASYGLILPQSVLDIPAIAAVNVHASLLPKLRGAAPIQRAIMNDWQDNITGVAIMRMAKGMDTGPVYAEVRTAIDGRNYQQLDSHLAHMGADLLLRLLPQIASGELRPVEQNAAEATYADKLTREDGRIDWHWSAARVDSLIRAVSLWPGAQAHFRIGDKDIPVIVEKGKPEEAADALPGSIRVDKNKVSIACCDRWFALETVKPEGRRSMPAQAFFNGLRAGRGIVGNALS